MNEDRTNPTKYNYPPEAFLAAHSFLRRLKRTKMPYQKKEALRKMALNGDLQSAWEALENSIRIK